MALNYPVFYKTMDVKGDAIVAQACATAVADATKLWNPEPFDGPFATKGFGISKLRAGDLLKSGANAGATPFSNMWTLSITTASTWETYIDVELSDSCYVIITGIFNYDGAPDVDEIKITAEGIEYPVIPLKEMYGWDVSIAYFSHPIVIRPEKTIKIEAKAFTAGRKDFGFLGFVVAKRSYLIGKL